jgi:hypothetical protein
MTVEKPALWVAWKEVRAIDVLNNADLHSRSAG